MKKKTFGKQCFVMRKIIRLWAKSTTPEGFWQSGPSQNGINFHGTIGPSVPPYTEYDYNIQAVLDSGALSKVLDPKITISPIPVK